MPGLFDPQGGGILGGVGDYFAGVRDRMDPQGALLRYQQQAFMRQLQDQMGPDPNNPKMSLGQALYNIQHPEIQYGMPQSAGTAKINGVEVPVYRGPRGDYSTPFGPLGGNNVPQPVGQTPASQNAGGTNLPNATSGQGGSAGLPGLQPILNLSNTVSEQEAAAKAQGEAEGKARYSLPSRIQGVESAIDTVDRILANPELPNRVGAKALLTAPYNTTGRDLENDFSTLQSQTLAQGVQALGLSSVPRNQQFVDAVGKSLGDIQEARKGTLGGTKDELGRLRKKLLDARAAAYKEAYPQQAVPAYSPSKSEPQFTEGQTAINKQTGQRMTFKNGNWQ